MSKKVSLNVFVDPRLREMVKIASVKQKITMAAFVERIILDWEQSHDQSHFS